MPDGVTESNSALVPGGISPLPEVNFVEQSEVGLSSLNAQDFTRLLITQLQNQDPTEPVGNDEILSQISQVRDLEASTSLTETLGSLVTGQNLTSASGLIGQTVSGRSAEGGDITGLVERASLRDGNVFVTVGGEDINVDLLSSVGLPPDEPAP